ncbi:phage tail protein [Pseudomonas chlororaphis]|nr:phage tail protein [Pseudomonas chlororaphis]
MDYPKSVPSVGLVNGKFVDENPVTGAPGSLIPAAWGNSITDEVVNVVKASGLVPDETDLGQLLLSIQKMNQSDAVKYALDTGRAGAYIASYAPALTAFVDGAMLRFKALNGNTGASTFSPNGLATKPIVGIDHIPLIGGEIVATGDVWVQWNSSIGDGAWVLIASSGAAKQTGADVADIKPVATVQPPKGWLKCNGDPVSRAQYPALFSAIGIRFGGGDGVSTFNLPDLRGEFLRGWDDGRGVDSGRALGSFQDSQNASHSHAASASVAGAHGHTASSGAAGGHAHTGSTSTDGNHQHGVTMGYTDLDSGNFGGGRQAYGTQYTNAAGAHSHTLSINAAADHTHAISVTQAPDHTHLVTVAASGGNESRPRNIALLYVIKY